MKDKRDLVKEYGLLLRWVNGSDEGPVVGEYTFYLEDLTNGNRIDITDERAITYIKKTTTPRFRDRNIYDSHIGLFEILGIKPLKTFNDLLEEKGFSGRKLSLESGVPAMTISDVRTGKTDFKKMSVETSLKISNALKMSVEEIYNYLYIR